MTARSRSALLLASLAIGAATVIVGGGEKIVDLRVAEAQGQAPKVTSRVLSEEVEVGEAFQVELSALSQTNERVTDPTLIAPPGCTVSGPSIGTKTFMRLGGGGVVSYSGITATWQVVASSAGELTIAAPTVTWNGQKLSAQPMKVRVAAAGSLPRRPRSPFLMPGGSMFGQNWPFPLDPNELDPEDQLDEPSLEMGSAPDKRLFLRVMTDKSTAVIGEQVTVSVYRYWSWGFEWEAAARKQGLSLADFWRVDLLTNPQTQPRVRTTAGGRPFAARLVERFAAFPVRTGTLSTGTITEEYFLGRGRSFLRTSNDQNLKIVEPPAQGRPVGYRLGDVGKFDISAVVQPRQVTAGGDVSVQVKVTGSGHFPPSLPVPEKAGVEWLEPEKKDQIAPRSGQVQGFRTFGYVVRLRDAGSVDLGKIGFSYYDAEAKAYKLAYAELGTVEVAPRRTPAPSASGSAAPAPEEDAPVGLGQLPGPREKLRPFAFEKATTPFEAWQFPAALLGAPLLALFGIGTLWSAGRMKERRALAKDTPLSRARQALEQARSAAKGGGAISAMERAVVLAIEAATGVRARGVLAGALAETLVKEGLSRDLADRCQALLEESATSQFAPSAPPVPGGGLFERGESLARDLIAAASKRPSPPEARP